jgi:hypothetical protein
MRLTGEGLHRFHQVPSCGTVTRIPVARHPDPQDDLHSGPSEVRRRTSKDRTQSASRRSSESVKSPPLAGVPRSLPVTLPRATLCYEIAATLSGDTATSMRRGEFLHRARGSFRQAANWHFCPDEETRAPPLREMRKGDEIYLFPSAHWHAGISLRPLQRNHDLEGTVTRRCPAPWHADAPPHMSIEFLRVSLHR